MSSNSQLGPPQRLVGGPQNATGLAGILDQRNSRQLIDGLQNASHLAELKRLQLLPLPRAKCAYCGRSFATMSKTCDGCGAPR